MLARRRTISDRHDGTSRHTRSMSGGTSVKHGVRSEISWRTARYAITTFALAMALSACGLFPSNRAPSADFTKYLDGYGQRFTLQDPPAEAADWHRAQPIVPAKVESAIYGVVTCFDPARNCAARGLVRRGESLAIWIVSYADTPEAQGCPLWVTVDATSGKPINGAGPPCG